MTDAFGGSFMLKLFLIFIIVYVSLTAVALNYAKAFKVKDVVVTYLEDNEIYDINKMTAIAEKNMRDYFYEEVVSTLHYTTELGSEYKCPANCKCFKDIGIIIEPIIPNNEEKNKKGIYYKVHTYISWDVGFLKILGAANGSQDGTQIQGKWRISGETKPIVKE